MIQDRIFVECEHKLFDYRPYRRGRYRCKVCGGRLPLSALGKMWRDWILDLIMTPNPLIDILTGGRGRV